MTLANNIRYLRKKQGWSQDYLAEQLGYKSYTTIQKWESGVSAPPLKKAHDIANLFQVDIDDLTKKELWTDESTEDLSSRIQDEPPLYLSITDSDPQIDAILRNARKLNAQGLERLEAYSDDLAGNPKYLKQKAPLTIAARGGDVMDTSQIDIEALKRGLKELDAEDNP